MLVIIHAFPTGCLSNVKQLNISPPLILVNFPDLLSLLLVSLGDGLDVVRARGEECVEVSSLAGEDPHAPIQHDHGTHDRLPALVPHHSTHTLMHLGRKRG